MIMAKEMIDYKVDGNNDLVITGGDFVRAESTGQHQKQLIICDKNEYKQNPTIGVGAFNFLDDDEPGDLLRAISTEFARDGMDVKRVEMGSNGVINTDASYK